MAEIAKELYFNSRIPSKGCSQMTRRRRSIEGSSLGKRRSPGISGIWRSMGSDRGPLIVIIIIIIISAIHQRYRQEDDLAATTTIKVANEGGCHLQGNCSHNLSSHQLGHLLNNTNSDSSIIATRRRRTQYTIGKWTLTERLHSRPYHKLAAIIITIPTLRTHTSAARSHSTWTRTRPWRPRSSTSQNTERWYLVIFIHLTVHIQYNINHSFIIQIHLSL